MSDARAMTNTEIAGFLFRHPIEALRVAETKTAIETGVYNWANYVLSQLPGRPLLIPPWGTQVEDSTYGTVTIFFDPNGTGHYTADSPVLGDINEPPYVPPPHMCKDGSEAILGFCPEDFDFSGLITAIAIGFGVYVGYRAFFAKK